MQRWIYIVLFLAVLILPFLMRLAMVRGEREHAAVPSAGRLVIITPHNQDIRREFARAFNAWYVREYGATVELDYRTPGGTGDIRRQLEITYRQHRLPDNTLPEAMIADIDIVWGGGDFFFDVELKPLGILQPLRIEPALLEAVFPEPALAGVRLYDHAVDADGNLLPPTWIGVCLSSFGIVYNPGLMEALNLPPPQSWRDLTHEKLNGMIALADPTHSGSAAVAYMMVLQRAMADAEEAFLSLRQEESGASEPLDAAQFRDDPGYQQAIAQGWQRGMAQLLLIAANARYFTGSATQVPRDVSIGDAAAGMAIDFYGRVAQETVGERRVRFISPAAATAITPDPVAILHGVTGRQRELAERFVHFLLTPQGQRLWILEAGQPGGPRHRALRRPPIRRDLYDDTTGWSDEVNPYEEAGDFNQRQEWMELFSDIRPIWSAAWIDSREPLRAAYDRILRVPDPQRRSALIAELADLPITMPDVKQLRDQRRAIQRARGPIDQWRAEQRIRWANIFREHYAEVARRAD